MERNSKITKSKKKDTNKKESKKKEEVYNESSDDEVIYISDGEGSSEDDISDDDSDDEKMTMLEYRKFLNNVFPSKHQQEKVDAGERLKEALETNEECIDEEDTDDEDYSDDESDIDEMLDDNKMNFNIVFTIAGGGEEEDEFSSSGSSEEDNDSEEEDEEKERKIYNTRSKKVFEKKDEKDTSSKTEEDKKESTSSSKKEKSTTKGEEEYNKNYKKYIEPEMIKKRKMKNEKTETIDSDTEKKFKTILESLKNKESDSELLNKMETYLEEEKKKKDKIKKQQEKKIKKKNLKLIKELLKEKNKMNDLKYIYGLSVEEQKHLINEIKKINESVKVDKPYRISLIESKIPTSYKTHAMKKVNSLRYMDPGSGEYYKIKQWVDTFMSIPFGQYSKLPVSLDDGLDKCQEFMNNAKDVLDGAVYGMNNAKMQIMQMMGQLISNPDSVGTAIAIKGPPGTGKTSIVKEGISKILGRPFAFISLGGATDSSYLEGHSYTYEGSVWGRIVDILIKSKTMNPVIYFDELDKISDTAKGEEITGILTHLTDTTQNSQFHDKYFSDIDFDLSKALFIFSYNDESKVNPILKDRMYRIKTGGYDTKEKKVIARDYLIPKIEKNVNFNANDVTITDDALEHIVKNLTEGEKGVRNYKRCLEIIYTKINLYRLMGKDKKMFDKEETLDIEFPYKVTKDIVDKLIKVNDEEKWYRHMYC